MKPLAYGALLCWTSAQAAHRVDLPASLAAPGTQVETVLEGLAYSEGPAVDPEGNLYFSEDPDVQTGRIWKITPEGTKSVFKEPSRGSNGLEIDNQGRLNIAMLDSLVRVEPDGKTTVLAATGGSLNLRRVNDLSIASTGAMFFTNLSGNTVFHRGESGQITSKSYSFVNGIEWIEEKSILYIATGGLKKCAVTNATGAIGVCAQFASNTDGLTTDAHGNVWRANWSEGAVFAHDSTGKELGSITIDALPVPGKSFTSGKGGNASNCHFGGPDLKTLFITGDGGCYKVRLNVAGRRRPGFPSVGIAPRASAKAGQRRAPALRFEGGRILWADARGNRSTLDGRALAIAPGFLP